MGARVVLHSDMNAFYASVEALYNPALRDIPMAVGGDPEQRHGIVLAKNELAKKFGVQTGDVLWEARKKCPNIVFVPPNFERYKRFSQLANEIYYDYTDQIEPFGLDESWLDVTGSQSLFGTGEKMANDIRARIKKELGITASIGVSFNKIFAKLGSDMKKPDATTVISADAFKEKVWPLPVGDLLYVGRATASKLRSRGIMTIGALARSDVKYLEYDLGVIGRMLWQFANGLDISPVSAAGTKSIIKSIGNSTTTPRDLVTEEDVLITFYALADSVAARLREQDYVCRTVQISVRDSQLQSFERQCKLTEPACISGPIVEAGMKLFRANVHPPFSLRSIGIRACDLMERQTRQVSFFADVKDMHRQEDIEVAVDGIRARYGHYAIQRGIMLKDKGLAINPKDDHTIHPVGYLR